MAAVGLTELSLTPAGGKEPAAPKLSDLHRRATARVEPFPTYTLIRQGVWFPRRLPLCSEAWLWKQSPSRTRRPPSTFEVNTDLHCKSGTETGTSCEV